MITREIEINAPVETVFEVVNDFGAYPQFLETTTSAKERKTKKGHFVDFEVSLIKKIHYTIKVEAEAPQKLSWTFVEGELMKDNSGSWELTSLGPDRTKAVYSVNVQFGWMVPQSIVDQLTKVQLPLLLDAFKVRMEQRAKRGAQA